jgi:putative ABC transport system permease protein
LVYAWDAVRRRPGRSALTALGIGLATGLVVLLLALSAGVETSAATLAYASGVDLLATSNASDASGLLSGVLPPIPDSHPLATSIPAADPNVETASPWLIEDLVFGNQSLRGDALNRSVPAGWGPTESGTVGWIPSDNAGIETPVLYNGSGFNDTGDPYYANGSYDGTPTHQIVLDQALAGVLGVSVGAEIWAQPSGPASNASLAGWYANATEFNVTGISGPFWLVPSELLSFVYLSELQALYGYATASTDYSTLILIHLLDPTSPASDQTRIHRAFPDLLVVTLADILTEVQHEVNVYRTFGILIGAIGLVVAALFATTILQMSVDDRSRELALLRAVGYPRARVGLMVAEEALLLSAFGLGVGLPVAWGAGVAINAFLLRTVGGLPAGFSFVSFDAPVILAGAGAVAAVGLLAAIAPASRAMLLPVAEELRAP